MLVRWSKVPIEAPMLERRFWCTHNTGKTVWSTYWSPNVGEKVLKYPQCWKDGLKYLLKPQCWRKGSEVPTMLERWSKVPIEAPMLERRFWSTHNNGKMVWSTYWKKPQCWREGSEVPTMLVRWSKVPIEAPMLERRFWRKKLPVFVSSFFPSWWHKNWIMWILLLMIINKQ